MSPEHGVLAEPPEELEQGRYEPERHPEKPENLESTETVREEVQEPGGRQRELLEQL